ncbi:MAG: hypothetical protein LQ347_002149 [Umbilicaria vellea]|nr:MAG: hypothetical protein LQ347_002149 [Umbilicaria vellea]
MAALSNLLPLLALVVVVIVAAFVCYGIYTVVTEIADKTQEKMEQKNVVFTKDGMRVGVKEVRKENYVDKAESRKRTQDSYWVGVWLTYSRSNAGAVKT